MATTRATETAPCCADTARYARGLGTGGWVRCECGAEIAVDARGAAKVERARARANRPQSSPALALLRDCTLIARWDAVSRPASVLPRKGNEGGGARPSATDKPDWQLDARHALARGGALRAKLDALHARGRVQTTAEAQLFAVLHALACLAAFVRDEPMPALPAPGPSDAEIAAAVVEYLVPRACVILDSVHGHKGTALLKTSTRDLAHAFATESQRAKWRPAAPTKPVAPEKLTPPPPLRAAPERPQRPPEGAKPDDVRDYEIDLRVWWMGKRAYERDAAAHALAVAAHEAAVAGYKEASRAYDRAAKLHPELVSAGKLGEERHGEALLALAQRVWFGELATER